jgi:DNA polymerase III delta prime subunit
MSTDFLLSPTWAKIEALLPHAHRILLYGPPGTGKTYSAIHTRPDGQTVYVNTLTDETPVAELRGHFVPQQEGGFQWMDGPAIAAWRSGGRYVLNEINLGSIEAQTFLYAILDDQDSAMITLPTGDTVTPEESFTVVATMNGQPSDLPPALLDRFPLALEVREIHPAALTRLPKEWREPASKMALIKDETRRVSIRRWLEFFRLLDAGVDKELVGWGVFGDSWKDVQVAITASHLTVTDEVPTRTPLPPSKPLLEEVFGAGTETTTPIPPPSSEPCPKCGGKLVRRYRRRDGKPFLGCTQWRTTGCTGTREVPHDAS